MKHIEELEKQMVESGQHCAESITQLHNANSTEQLVDLMFDYSKACEEKKFPSLSWLRKHFSNAKADHIFCDAGGTVVNAKKVLVMGQSHVTVKASDFTITRILVKHNSVVDVVLEDRAHVLIDRRENGTANIIQKSPNARVIWLH